MLKYKINVKDAKEKYIILSTTATTMTEDNELLHIVADNSNIRIGDEIIFSRIEEDDIKFYESRFVRSIEKDGFSVDNFQDIDLKVDSISPKIAKRMHYGLGYTDFMVFDIKEGYEHFLFKNRTFKDKSGNTIFIKENIKEEYDTEEEDFTMRRCEGDYLTYNEWFLYTASSVNNFNRYEFTNFYLNKGDSVVTVILNNEAKNEIEKLSQKEGAYWKYEDGILYLKSLITPSKSDGKDNRNKLVWIIENTQKGEAYQIAEILVENLPNLLFRVKDERFFTIIEKASENVSKCQIINTTKIAKKDYSIKLDNLISEAFSPNLIQEELLGENYVDSLIDKHKNKIIDYEKQIFEPVFFSGDTISGNVEEINFLLRFRERSNRTEWKSKNEDKWNSSSGGCSDLLGYLNFTDDDVYYRKKRLSKSFLRLSFYDTKNRANQSLLFTSTIFMNDIRLFSNYMRLVNNEIPMEEGGYVFTEVDENRLDSIFSCKGKFFNEISNNYNDNSSSEGFYLYLFPSIIEQGEIYMKVEFNHAKYGYTIPFTFPKNGTPPETYIEKDSEGNEYANMNRLFNDMYIPIMVGYDSVKNRYVWGIEGVENKNNILKLMLFEPRING